MKITSCKITKTTQLQEVNNDMCHNFYYLVYGKAYINEHQYYHFKMVLWFDIFDLQEYYNADVITKQDIKDYVNDVIYGATSVYTDTKDLIDYCNETIINYNNINKY